MIRPSLDEAQQAVADGAFKRIPLSVELLADRATPLQVLRRLRHASRHCFLLESAEASQSWGRYSFLGFDPSLELTCVEGTTTLKTASGVTTRQGHPAEVIREVLREHKSPRFSFHPPFTGGLVGYFAWDYIAYEEPSLHLDARDEEGFKDVDLMLFDRVIAFDHYRQKIILIVNIPCENLEQSYEAGKTSLRELCALVLEGEMDEQLSGKLTSPLEELFSEAAYSAMVERAIEYIREGDIFQVVLANRLSASFEGSLLDTYRALRASNPSPYMFFFSSAELEIAGASPETLVKLKDGVLQTYPLAGTRPRGADDAEDCRLAEELLADEKELAEHNMLVDLGRNDIGRISRYGTVEVTKYLAVERFSHVMHLGSTVRGELRPDCDELDVIGSILPAGTLSGAPKIRACQIINELEQHKRGIYGGAIGYIDFTGNLDTCIAIRIAYRKNGKVFVRAGAGIVADSVPVNEYRECRNKTQAVVNALNKAQEGLDHDPIGR